MIFFSLSLCFVFQVRPRQSAISLISIHQSHGRTEIGWLIAVRVRCPRSAGCFHAKCDWRADGNNALLWEGGMCQCQRDAKSKSDALQYFQLKTHYVGRPTVHPSIRFIRARVVERCRCPLGERVFQIGIHPSRVRRIFSASMRSIHSANGALEMR